MAFKDDITRQMNAIAEGVRNPTYQNPPAVSTNAPPPQAASFADLQRAMGARPTGEVLGQFNPTDPSIGMAKFMPSGYSVTNAGTERAGIRGQTPPPRPEVGNQSIKQFVGGDKNLARGFNAYPSPAQAQAGYAETYSEPSLARELYGNPNARASGPANFGTPMNVPNFTMNGASSEVPQPSRALAIPSRDPLQAANFLGQLTTASRNPAANALPPQGPSAPQLQIEGPERFAARENSAQLRGLSIGDPRAMAVASQNPFSGPGTPNNRLGTLQSIIDASRNPAANALPPQGPPAPTMGDQMNKGYVPKGFWEGIGERINQPNPGPPQGINLNDKDFRVAGGLANVLNGIRSGRGLGVAGGIATLAGVGKEIYDERNARLAAQAESARLGARDQDITHFTDPRADTDPRGVMRGYSIGNVRTPPVVSTDMAPETGSRSYDPRGAFARQFDNIRTGLETERAAGGLAAAIANASTPATPAEQQRQGYLTGSFGEAFKKARAAAGGGQGQFSYMGPDGQVRQYQTNIRGEKYVPTGQQTDVTSQIAPTLASAVQSQANAPAVATAPGIAPVPAGTPAYNDADRRYQTYIRQQQAAATQAGANQDIFPPFPGDPGEVIRAPKSLGGTGPDVSDVTVRQPGGFQSAVIDKSTGKIVDQFGSLPPRERSYTVRQPEASPTGMKMPTPVGVRGGNLVFEGGGTMPIGDYEKLQQVVAPKPQPADQLNLLSTAITSASDQLNALPKDSPEYNRLLARKNSYELQRKMMLENLSKKPFEGGGLNAAIEALQTR